MTKEFWFVFLLAAEAAAIEKGDHCRADEIREDYLKFCNGEYDYLF